MSSITSSRPGQEEQQRDVDGHLRGLCDLVWPFSICLAFGCCQSVRVKERQLDLVPIVSDMVADCFRRLMRTRTPHLGLARFLAPGTHCTQMISIHTNFPTPLPGFVVIKCKTFVGSHKHL